MNETINDNMNQDPLMELAVQQEVYTAMILNFGPRYLPKYGSTERIVEEIAREKIYGTERERRLREQIETKGFVTLDNGSKSELPYIR